MKHLNIIIKGKVQGVFFRASTKAVADQLGVRGIFKNEPNGDVFIEDPTKYIIPNNGVAKVIDPQTPEEWNVLRFELEHFVCEGEYQTGLARILSTYIFNLSEAEQPAVWVSGFYGSGKSHLVRVLEYLWRDT